MKQIKNKLNKIDKEIEFLQKLENTHIKVANNSNKDLKKHINKEVDNLLFKYSIAFGVILTILAGILIGNTILTAELHEQYYIEEKCTCNE